MFPSFFKIIVFLYFSFAALISGVLAQEKLTLFSQPGQKGRGLIFTGREPDVRKLKSVIPLVKSYCVTGMWGIYDAPHYRKDFIRFISPDQESCGNLTVSWKSISSLRPLGPQNNETPGITIYSGESFTGSDEFLNADASGLRYLTFEPKSIILTGNSSWTLYENQNFNGKSICVRSKRKIQEVKLYAHLDYAKVGISTVGSVLVGCH